MKLLKKILNFLKFKKKPKYVEDPIKVILEKTLNSCIISLKENDNLTLSIKEIPFIEYEDLLLNSTKLSSIISYYKYDRPLSYFIFSSETENYFNDLSKMGNSFIIDTADKEKKELNINKINESFNNQNEIKSLWWKLVDYRIYQIKINDKKFHFLFDEYYLKNIIKNQSKIEIQNIENIDKTSIKIINDKTWIFSSLFLPEIHHDSNQTIISRLVKMSEPDNEDNFESCFNIKINYTHNSKSFPVIYIFKDTTIENIKKDHGQEFASVFSTISKSNIKEIKKILNLNFKVEKLTGNNNLKNITKTDYIKLTYYLKIFDKEYITDVLITKDLIELILINLKLKKINHNLIDKMLHINLELYKKNCADYSDFIKSKQNIYNNPVKNTLLLYSFINILERKDLNKLLQSFIALGNQLAKIKDFFYFLNPDNTKTLINDFNEERFLLYIPERWMENYKKDIDFSIKEKSIIEKNIEIMKQIYQLKKNDKLILSPQASEILENEYGKNFKIKMKQNFQKMINDKTLINIYKMLNQIEKNSLRSFTTQKWFIQSLIGEDLIYNDLKTILSEKNKKIFIEDYNYIIKKITSEQLAYEEIIINKKKCADTLNTIIKKRESA